jgi:hypothetical protein
MEIELPENPFGCSQVVVNGKMKIGLMNMFCNFLLRKVKKYLSRLIPVT